MNTQKIKILFGSAALASALILGATGCKPRETNAQKVDPNVSSSSTPATTTPSTEENKTPPPPAK